MLRRNGLMALTVAILASTLTAAEPPATERDEAAARAKFPPNTWVAIDWELKIHDGALPPGIKTGRYASNHHYGGMAYRPASGRTLILDGYAERMGDSVLGTPTIYANSLYGLDPVKGVYHLYKTSNYRGAEPMPRNVEEPTPSPRHTYECFAYVADTDSLYLWTGANKMNGYAAREGTREKVGRYAPKRWVSNENRKILGMWAWSFRDRKWRTIDRCKQYPPGGYENAMVYLPATKKIWFVSTGGEVWTFDIKGEQWTKESMKMKWNRYRGTTFADTKRNRIVSYSGKQTRNGQATGCALGVLDVATGTFRELGGKGPRPPAPRSDGGMCYHSKHDLYVAFGGAGRLTDNHVFDPDTNTWRQFAPAANVTVKAKQSFVKLTYDSVNDLVVMSRRGEHPEWWAMRLEPATARWVEADKE
jgi:hypothetical protein